MQELWKLVTSPRHLIVFEVAARHGSFTRAAAELNVQQPAVSASIAQLEASLGVLLFDRAHRKVGLTHAGERLFSDVSAALNRILQSAREVHQRGRNDHVTVSVSSAFANYWMVPRLQQFHDSHPGIDLRVQTSDREPDIDAEGISLAIRRGDGSWPGVHSALIAHEVISPIASPQVMAAAVNLVTPANLLHERLIHLEEPVRERPSWQAWFAHHDIPAQAPKAGLRLNDYALVLQAAMAGEGFAFGWRHVTRRLIEQGLLAAKTDWAWETGKGFYLVWSKTVPLIPQAEQVRDWMIGMGEGEEQHQSAAPVKLTSLAE
ncbi:Glycine cleavage system transcriptional activator [Falsiruegeria litorea R37]|uniref:Glycine cleavage system transcriptional activator n=1 Tax=Falsiruegeria litorea R37 TaxID=1200284 RepID=A0A1Y5T3A7_9RHOB|nr:LysR substrate-binding domain-containing protein [Falsiruegeria litorea]SLN54763.1 Glycine cleavage system transcriptional activator [Falsiruegeria litorea R37]